MGTNDDERRNREERIAAEASDWWARLELGTADAEAFNRWRDANPAHALAYARLQASWEALLDEKQALAPAGALEPAAETGLSRRRLLRSAGIGAVAVTAGSIFWATRAAAWERASTGIGEMRRITLPDASVLELNTDTEVAWRFTDRAREIRLERGEIAVAVAAGPPAMLIATTASLALFPGRFNARLIGDKIGLTVLRGRVVAEGYPARAASPGASAAGMVIGEGEAAQFTPGGATVQKITPEDRALLTAWQSGDIMFQNASLQAAVDEYNRYLTRKIMVDARLRALRVGGRFTSSDPSAFLEAVATGLDVAVRDTPSGIRIEPKK